MKEFSEYIKSLEISNKSKATIRAYSKDIEKFLSFFNIESVEQIQKLTANDYRNFISGLGLAPASVNGCIRNLSAFHNWLQENGNLENSAFFHAKFGKSRYVKVIRKDYDILNDEEVGKLVRAGETLQERFMLALMVTVGLRRDEVAKIKLSDISECKIKILGKGNKYRNVWMNEQLCALLNIYLAQRNDTCEYLFHFGNHGITGCAVNNRVIRAMKKAGLDETKTIRAHGLRRTAASNLIVEYDIYTAQKVLGHSNINTTKLYDFSKDAIVENALLKSTRKIDLE